MSNTSTSPSSAPQAAFGERAVAPEDRTPSPVETKNSLKTTELFVYLATVIGIIITAAAVGASRGSQQDPFGAFQALQLITFATVGYLVSRGFAKSGTRQPR